VLAPAAAAPVTAEKGKATRRPQITAAPMGAVAE